MDKSEQLEQNLPGEDDVEPVDDLTGAPNPEQLLRLRHDLLLAERYLQSPDAAGRKTG